MLANGAQIKTTDGQIYMLDSTIDKKIQDERLFFANYFSKEIGGVSKHDYGYADYIFCKHNGEKNKVYIKHISSNPEGTLISNWADFKDGKNLWIKLLPEIEQQYGRICNGGFEAGDLDTLTADELENTLFASAGWNDKFMGLSIWIRFMPNDNDKKISAFAYHLDLSLYNSLNS